MSKIRVYELARELKIESKLLVNKLKDIGIEVSSHQSTLTADQIVRIKRELSGEGAGKAPKPSPSVIRRRKGPGDEKEAAASSEGDGDHEVAANSDIHVHEEVEEEAPRQVGVSAEVETAMESAHEDAEDESLLEISETEPQPILHQEQPTVSAAPIAAPVVEDEDEPETPSPRMDVRPTASTPVRQEARAPSPAPVSEGRPMQRAPEGMSVTPDTAKIVRREAPPSAAPSVAASSAPGAVGPRIPGAATIVRRAPTEEDVRPRSASTARIMPVGTRPAPRVGTGEGGGGSGITIGPRIGIGERRPLGTISKGPDLNLPEDGGLGITGVTRWRDDGLKSKDKKRSFANVETPDENVLKKALKPKRDQVNLRTLLNQAEPLDEDIGEDVEVLPEAPVVVDKKKLIYTPQSSGRKKDLKRRKDLKKTQLTTPRASYRVVKMGSDITVAELAKQLSVKAAELIKKLMAQGVMATMNQAVDFDTATLLANDYHFEVKSNVVSIEDILSDNKKAHDSAELEERPPIVTIMGHVDHGKTSILDAIRKAKVAAGEAGGITQHIGAYTVEKAGRKIAFLDTPGHEAFSAMRSRGAKVTDIVVLVVAADDGVMPQTIEAISHARDAHVPIIVAINKIDKPSKNLDRVYRELAEHGIQSEEWGGETQYVKVSALQGIGIEELLDAILLQAEVLELKSPINVPASGVVVEAHLDIGRGPVATMMIQKGIVRIGDFLVAGTTLGRVRAMHDYTGKRLKEAGPSTPVEIVGLSEVPMAGDHFDVVEDEKTAKEVAGWRRDVEFSKALNRSSAATLDQLLAKVKAADTPEVPVIIKADTMGSVEAIAEAVMKLNTDRVRNRIVHKAVGGINESDMALAATSNAVIIGFNVRAARGLDDNADKAGVLIKYFSVIYDIVDVLKSIMAGKLPPVQKEVILGHAEVRATIKVPKIGLVAGTSILDGKVTRNSQLRLIRNDVVIYAGRIGSLRRFKDDVKEVVQGYECGIGIEGFSDVREGDVIEAFIIEEHAPAL